MTKFNVKTIYLLMYGKGMERRLMRECYYNAHCLNVRSRQRDAIEIRMS